VPKAKKRDLIDHSRSSRYRRKESETKVCSAVIKKKTVLARIFISWEKN